MRVAISNKALLFSKCVERFYQEFRDHFQSSTLLERLIFSSFNVRTVTGSDIFIKARYTATNERLMSVDTLCI